MDKKQIEREILVMEKMALQMLGTSNIRGYLDIYSEDITYFDPFQECVIHGKENMTVYAGELIKKFPVKMYEIIDPIIIVNESLALLVFKLDIHTDECIFQWKCTEVYRLEEDSHWRIIHSHWSFCRPMDIPNLELFAVMPSFEKLF